MGSNDGWARGPSIPALRPESERRSIAKATLRSTAPWATTHRKRRGGQLDLRLILPEDHARDPVKPRPPLKSRLQMANTCRRRHIHHGKLAPGARSAPLDLHARRGHESDSPPRCPERPSPEPRPVLRVQAGKARCPPQKPRTREPLVGRPTPSNRRGRGSVSIYPRPSVCPPADSSNCPASSRTGRRSCKRTAARPGN